MKVVHSGNISRILFWLLMISAVWLLVLLPVFYKGFLVTDDGNWMVIRLSAFYQSLREGQFPVRFLGRLNYSYGYPVSNFLYPGFLYVGTILHLAGLSFQESVEVIIAGFVLAGAAGIFFWLRRFFDDRASAIGAVSFLLSPYLLYDIFKRGSVGEIVAIGTVMWVLYAVESDKSWLVAPLSAFLLISHNTLAVVFFCFLSGYILVRKKWNQVSSLLLSVGISAFFWMPILYEKHFVIFDAVAVSDPTHYFSVSNALIVQSLPYLILGGLTILLSKRSITAVHWYLIGSLTAATFFTSGLSRQFWDISLLSRIIQFPYRFLALTLCAGPWFFACVADKKKVFPGMIIVLSGLLFYAYSALPYQSAQSEVRPEGYYTTNEDSTTVANEYMPKWVRILPVKRAVKRVEINKGNAQIEEHFVSTEKIDVIIHAEEFSELQVNTIFYPGWGAMIDDAPVPISYDNPQGIMRIGIPKGDHRIYMAFRETKSRFIADLVSIVCILIWFSRSVVSPVLIRRKERQGNT